MLTLDKIYHAAFVLRDVARRTDLIASLNAVNLDIGAQALDGKGHTGQQAAAAHGHHNSFHIGQLIQNFQANSTSS